MKHSDDESFAICAIESDDQNTLRWLNFNKTFTNIENWNNTSLFSIIDISKYYGNCEIDTKFFTHFFGQNIRFFFLNIEMVCSMYEQKTHTTEKMRKSINWFFLCVINKQNCTQNLSQIINYLPANYPFHSVWIYLGDGASLFCQRKPVTLSTIPIPFIWFTGRYSNY